MNKKTAILLDRRYHNHQISRQSLENADRIRGLYLTLEEERYANSLQFIKPREASLSDITAVHSEMYLDQIRQHAASGDPYAYDKDTYLMEETFYTAQLAAGGCLELADLIMAGEADYGFGLIRPPGHHAEAGRGMGFCVLNNIAVTAEYLRKVYGLQRILIFDFDVHHCNGTQSVFYENSQVLVMSIHEERIFPFTGSRNEIGKEEGCGYTINLPVHAQFADEEYTYLTGKVLSSVVEQYLPQIILVSAGYDAHKEETISKTLLSTSWFASITSLLKILAKDACDNRLLFVLEGGYNPTSLQQAVLATIDELINPRMLRPGIMYSERAQRILWNHPLHTHWTL
ncbi:histone deacetylase family protein [Desulfogranum japonicum]|uniref:histone deacetylase family protein n=1 Tax=Desulfogranum japonicum TaxID=231447 RepID=UPI0003F8693A|nr:histone deacetylase [Desulfogranum japonicum]